MRDEYGSLLGAFTAVTVSVTIAVTTVSVTIAVTTVSVTMRGPMRRDLLDAVGRCSWLNKS